MKKYMGPEGTRYHTFLLSLFPNIRAELGWQGERIEGISRSSCCQVRWAAEAKQKLKREVLFVTRLGVEDVLPRSMQHSPSWRGKTHLEG